MHLSNFEIQIPEFVKDSNDESIYEYGEEQYNDTNESP
jgi:hypothetical protein